MGIQNLESKIKRKAKVDYYKVSAAPCCTARRALRRAEGGDPQGIQHPAQEFRFLQDEHVVFQRRSVGNDTQLENFLTRLE